MPELPDVENFKRHFKKTGFNKKIIDIKSSAPELIKEISFKDFKQRLMGRSFENAFRRGKFLIIKVKEISERLIIHFGMAGNLHYVKQGEERKGEDRFTRLCFEFANGYDIIELINNLIEHFRNLFIVKIQDEKSSLLDIPPAYIEKYKEESSYFQIEDLMRLQQLLINLYGELRRTTQPRILVELTLVKMTKFDFLPMTHPDSSGEKQEIHG